METLVNGELEEPDVPLNPGWGGTEPQMALTVKQNMIHFGP